MRQIGYSRVDRVQQPENSDLRTGEVGERGGSLAPLFSQRTALRDQYLDQLAEHILHPGRGPDVKHRRNIILSQFELAGSCTLELCYFYRTVTVSNFFSKQDSKV